MSAAELRDAYKALKFLQEALAKSKEELGMCRSHLKLQEEQHLSDLQTLQAELNLVRAKAVQPQPPAACQHHGQGLEALQRQYTNELKKLRDELDNAVQYRQRAEGETRERQEDLQAEKLKTAALETQIHTLETSMASLQTRLNESAADKASLEARMADAVALSNSQEVTLRSHEAKLAQARENSMELQAEKHKTTALETQIRTLETSMGSLQTLLDDATADKASLEALKAELVALSDSHEIKWRSLEATLALTVSELTTSQEACAALAHDKRRLEEELVVARLHKVEELTVPPVSDADIVTVDTASPSSLIPNTKLAAWKDKLRDLTAELRGVRDDVEAMKSVRVPIVTMDVFQPYLVESAKSRQQTITALSTRVGSLRQELQATKDLWATVSSDVWKYLTSQVAAFALLQAGREAQVEQRRAHMASQLQALRTDHGILKAMCMTWQREAATQVAQVLTANKQQIQAVARQGEAAERQLMAHEDTTSLHFRQTPLPESITWRTLERRLCELKSPFHRALQSLDQANYALKLMIRNTDMLGTLGSAPMQSRVVEFATFMESLLIAVNDSTLERVVATHSNAVHDLLYTWQPCDPTFLETIPVPAFGLDSPEVAHILSSWTSDIAARAAATRWLAAVSLSHPTNESSFRFVGLTREVKDAILVLVVPLIQAKRPVHVRLKRQSTTDAKWDVAIDTASTTSPQHQSQPPQSAMFKAIQRRLSELQK